MTVRSAIVLAALLLPLAAQAAETPMPTAPTLDEMRNATYRSIPGIKQQTVTLSGGRWETSAPRSQLSYVSDLRLVGDLNADGREESLGLLSYNGGGSGTFYYLVMLDRSGASVRHLATAPVGDRVQLRSARIDGNKIVMDVVQTGARDAACCPGDLVTRTFTLRGKRLVENGRGVVTGRLTLDTIGTGEWRLTHWNLDDPVTASFPLTLQMDNGKFVGMSGCNQYVADVTAGRSPGALRIDIPSGTTAACPEDVKTVEQRFLEALQGSDRFSFMNGNLALNYRAGSLFGTMMFEPVMASSASTP